MKILIVEDDKAAVEAIKDAMSYTEDMQVVGTTDSATQGLKLVEAVKPHAIILDLELNEGDGLNFLRNLSTLMLDYKPFVLVTTNTTSKTVHDIVRNNGGDFIYTKNTLNYNPMPWSVSCNQWAIIWKLRLPKKICVGSHAPN